MLLKMLCKKVLMPPKMPCKKALTLAKTLGKQPAHLLQFIKTLRHPVQGFFCVPGPTRGSDSSLACYFILNRFFTLSLPLPMPKDNGKVIVSLLAGATAGIVTGLLLAPETGEDARKGIRESASKWGGSLGKLVQNALGKRPSQPATNPDAAVSEDRTAADALFDSMNSQSQPGIAEPGDLTTSATGNGRSIGGNGQTADDNDLD
jgi:gas vesicle protein